MVAAYEIDAYYEKGDPKLLGIEAGCDKELNSSLFIKGPQSADQCDFSSHKATLEDFKKSSAYAVPTTTMRVISNGSDPATKTLARLNSCMVKVQNKISIFQNSAVCVGPAAPKIENSLSSAKTKK
jgi:hypothetical protein